MTNDLHDVIDPVKRGCFFFSNKEEQSKAEGEKLLRKIMVQT